MLIQLPGDFEGGIYDAWTTVDPDPTIESYDLSKLEKQPELKSGESDTSDWEVQHVRQLELAYLGATSRGTARFTDKHCTEDWLEKSSFRKGSNDTSSSNATSADYVQYPPSLLVKSESTSADDWIAKLTQLLTNSLDIPQSTKAIRPLWDDRFEATCYGHHIASPERIQSLLALHRLPLLHGSKLKRDARSVYWSMFRSLWVWAIVVNVSILAVIISQPRLLEGLTYHQASTATAVNFVLAALGRQEHVINILFRVACCLPRWTPLCLRRQAAHLYAHGGLHAGCGASAFLWYICFTILLVKEFQGTYLESAALGPLTAIILAILLLVLITSIPSFKTRHRHAWEVSHRYGGWSAIILSWAQTFIIDIGEAATSYQPLWKKLILSTTFWVLSIISCCLIYPWLRLRRRTVEPEILSDHAIRLWFNDRKLPGCVKCQLSHAPLLENHGFATIPNANHQIGYSVVVPQTGEWSKDLIRHPPKHIWMRGAPTIGVLRIAMLFRPIVVVATGSGIGPCLSFIQDNEDYPMRILWSARAPGQTYGCDIINAVLRADRSAMIIDTEKTRCPDLVALTYALYRQSRAEAVVVVSTASITRQLIYEMEARKIAAFGPVYDA